MAAANTGGSEFTLTLTEEERRELLLVLEQASRDKEVEAHRTEAFAAKQLVQHQADVLQRLVSKVRSA
jgi:hypothetical protein